LVALLAAAVVVARVGRIEGRAEGDVTVLEEGLALAEFILLVVEDLATVCLTALAFANVTRAGFTADLDVADALVVPFFAAAAIFGVAKLDDFALLELVTVALDTGVVVVAVVLAAVALAAVVVAVDLAAVALLELLLVLLLGALLEVIKKRHSSNRPNIIRILATNGATSKKSALRQN